MKQVFIIGQPNVGKSYIISEIRKDPRFFVPKHATNRPKRSDDDDFYIFKDKTFFLENKMYLSVCDTYGRFYGVPYSEIDFNKEHTHIFMFNGSIKSIDDILNFEGEKIICVILSKNISQKIKTATDKYDENEIKYRIDESVKEENILKKLISEKNLDNLSIFFVEDYSNYEKLYGSIIEEIEHKIIDSNMIINKKVLYPYKIYAMTQLVSFFESVGKDIRKFQVIYSENTWYYTYRNIRGRRLQLSNERQFIHVFEYLTSIERKKISYQINHLSSNCSIFTEIDMYFNKVNNKNSKYKNDKWEFFLEDYKYEKRNLSNFFESTSLYISHGDLHNKNIILKDTEINFIDYDEVSYAPLYFDVIVFVYRYINSEAGKLDEIKLYKIKNILNFHDFQYVLKIIKIYIVKVILQKKYLEIEGITTVFDWHKDSWDLWKMDFDFIKNCEE